LIFGVGFALLGYCPGTVAGAVGTGALDALGGMLGMVVGAGIFAEAYPKLRDTVLQKGPFPAVTVPEFLHLPTWTVIVLLEIAMIALLAGLGYIGL
jgi:hypothetical protein